MTGVIGQVLPLAVAVALSTVPIIAAILILLSDAKPRVSIALLIGWTCGMAAVLGLLTIGFTLIPASSPTRDDTAIGITRILLGGALLTYSIVKWRSRARRTRDTPRWMGALGRITSLGALGLGVALAFRPKNVILSLAAAVIIGDALLRVADVAIVVAIFTVIGVSTVAVPVIGHSFAPERTQKPLDATRSWILTNSGTIMLVVALTIGVVIIGSGISRL